MHRAAFGFAVSAIMTIPHFALILENTPLNLQWMGICSPEIFLWYVSHVQQTGVRGGVKLCNWTLPIVLIHQLLHTTPAYTSMAQLSPFENGRDNIIMSGTLTPIGGLINGLGHCYSGEISFVFMVKNLTWFLDLVSSGSHPSKLLLEVLVYIRQ